MSTAAVDRRTAAGEKQVGILGEDAIKVSTCESRSASSEELDDVYGSPGSSSPRGQRPQSSAAAMANRDEPWEDEKYLNPPKGSTDRWEVRGNSDWMVRRHSKPRLTSFHPLHKNRPAEDLGSERVTVKFMDGKRIVEKDE